MQRAMGTLTHVIFPATGPMQRPGARLKSRLRAMSSKPTEKVPSACAERPPQDIEMTSSQQLVWSRRHCPRLPPPAPRSQLPQESLASEYGGNSEFHPMSLATVEQSSSDLAAQGSAPNGMTIVPQRNRKSKRTFPTLGFRLVWNDAPNTAQQDTSVIYRKYKKVKTLGKGSFGTAVLLRHRRTGHLVVSKEVRVQEMPRAELSKVERKKNQP